MTAMARIWLRDVIKKDKWDEEEREYEK